jgi:hypothetical protein
MNSLFSTFSQAASTDIDPAFEPVAKVAWGGRETSSVSDDDHGDFDAANPNCATEREQNTTTALNDEDFSADFDDIDSTEALKTCGPESDDDEATRTIKRSKIHLVKARAHILNGDRAEAFKAVNTAYGHLDRYHRAMKAAGQED